MKKNESGFTLVELIVVIAVLAVLAGLVIPRFVNANMAARGSKILADISACESAINIYYVRNGSFPTDINVLVPSYVAAWPKPPTGNAIVANNLKEGLLLNNSATRYVYVNPDAGSELKRSVGRVTLGGMTIEEILSTSEESLTLTDVD